MKTAEINLNYQDGVAREMLDCYEAVALRLPVSMTEMFDTVTEFTLSGAELWWRMLLEQAGGFFAGPGLLSELASEPEVEALAAELWELRDQFYAARDQSPSTAALSARLDRLEADLGAIREQVRSAASRAAIATEDNQRLRAEVQSLRHELLSAANERQAFAATLKDLHGELRALRDRIDSPPAAQPPARAESRAIEGDPRRKRR